VGVHVVVTSMIKCIIKFEDRQLKVKVSDDTSVAGLQIKLRRFVELEPEEAVFLFFDGWFRKCLYPGDRMLKDICKELQTDTLVIEMTRENTFGAWSKMFVKAKIEKRKDLYVATATFSYFGLYHWDQCSVWDSLEEATDHLLRVRCGGCLSIDVTPQENRAALQEKKDDEPQGRSP